MTRIIISTEDGEVLHIIEHVEEYDLSKPLGRAALIEEIEEAFPTA